MVNATYLLLISDPQEYYNDEEVPVISTENNDHSLEEAGRQFNYDVQCLQTSLIWQFVYR